ICDRSAAGAACLDTTRLRVYYIAESGTFSIGSNQIYRSSLCTSHRDQSRQPRLWEPAIGDDAAVPNRCSEPNTTIGPTTRRCLQRSYPSFSRPHDSLALEHQIPSDPRSLPDRNARHQPLCPDIYLLNCLWVGIPH